MNHFVDSGQTQYQPTLVIPEFHKTCSASRSLIALNLHALAC